MEQSISSHHDIQRLYFRNYIGKGPSRYIAIYVSAFRFGIKCIRHFICSYMLLDAGQGFIDLRWDVTKNAVSLLVVNRAYAGRWSGHFSAYLNDVASEGWADLDGAEKYC